MRVLRSLLICVFVAMPVLASAAPARLHPDLSSLTSVPMHKTESASISKALAIAKTGSKSDPVQFAIATPLSLGLDGGLWDQADATTDRWRARVSSNGALGLGLEFSKFALPAGAALWIYDEAGQLVQGPYTQADQTPEGKLWTAIVPGSSAVLELQVPSAQRDAVQLQLGNVDHAFLDMTKAATVVAAKSGSCNVDMVCPDGDSWRAQGRAVAMISIGNKYVCGGQLLNNARQNKDPLFITANHCEIGQTASTPASSVVFYWNYQTSTCGGTPDGSLSENQSGSTLIAADTGSDFTLLRLLKTPASAYNVYYSGWDVGSAIPQSGVAIHHPQGDEKRISTYTSPASRATVCLDDSSSSSSSCTRKVQTWQINWARGTTEEGSSGGGLWNQSHRLVGVLSGGDSSCTDTSGNDYFARLEVAYTANSAASGQLKAWLDPDSVGISSLDGLESSASATPVTSTSGSVSTTSSSSSSGGGGAMQWPALLIFAALAALRVQRRRVISARACRDGSAA
jgi:lysyl endopeptidase